MPSFVFHPLLETFFAVFRGSCYSIWCGSQWGILSVYHCDSHHINIVSPSSSGVSVAYVLILIISRALCAVWWDVHLFMVIILVSVLLVLYSALVYNSMVHECAGLCMYRVGNDSYTCVILVSYRGDSYVQVQWNIVEAVEVRTWFY